MKETVPMEDMLLMMPISWSVFMFSTYPFALFYQTSIVYRSDICIVYNVQCFAFIKLVVNDQAGLTIISFTLAGVKAVICYQSPSLVEHYSSGALSDLKKIIKVIN